MAALRYFFAIKINPFQHIPCGQYILADKFLTNSGYLVEREILSTFGCQFPSKTSFEKSKNTEVCLNLTLLPTNANLGRITRIMETNISLLELLFVLNNQIIDINI